MAAPVADKIQLPLDTGNTGKKIRSQTRVVGADTVHEHFFIPISPRSKIGSYSFHSGVKTVSATAHNGTTTGNAWLINPVGTANKMALRKIEHKGQITTGANLPTAPRLALALITFTGTASGASVSPAKHDSSYAATSASMRSAPTGLTVTLVNLLRATFPPVMAGTAGWTFVPTTENDWDFGAYEDGQPILRAGEGIVYYQPDVGSAGDTRACMIDVQIEEFE